MSKVRQKQVFNGENGLIYYEITFTALTHDWIDSQTYEQVSEMIDNRLLRPESFEAQTAYDALTGMMSMWKIHRHVANDNYNWKAGFEAAWTAAGGHIDDLK
jgi:hypothetical protein